MVKTALGTVSLPFAVYHILSLSVASNGLTLGDISCSEETMTDLRVAAMGCPYDRSLVTDDLHGERRHVVVGLSYGVCSQTKVD